MQEENFTGVLFDQRTEEQKQTDDVHFAELVSSSAPVNWVEKATKDIRKFPIYNQNGSGSCVAQTTAKLWGIMYWLQNGKEDYVHGSATHIYQRRSNKPAGGMAGEEAFAIGKQGITLEDLVPSQNMTDAEMDAVKIPQYKVDVGKIFQFGDPVVLNAGNIEEVASTIQVTGKGVMVWFYFSIDEWTVTPTVKNASLDLYAPSTCRHSVTAVDYTILGQSNVTNNPELWGKKALVIDDSWGTHYGQAGQRFITEDFFKARNWYARHVQKFKFETPIDEVVIPTPVNTLKHMFNMNLKFIPWDTKLNQPSDINLNASQRNDVIALQNILKAEGCMASNVQSTGYYGALTAKSVLALQQKYHVADPQSLIDLGGKNVGPSTRAFLNQKYSI